MLSYFIVNSKQICGVQLLLLIESTTLVNTRSLSDASWNKLHKTLSIHLGYGL